MARIFTNAAQQGLSAPSSTVLNLGSLDFTVAAWVLRPAAGSNDVAIVGKRNWDNGVGWELKIRDAANRTVRWDVQGSGAARQRAEGAIPNLNDGNWHLLIGRRATASYVDLWGDNSLIATLANPTTGSVDNALAFRISGSPNDATRCFDGWIAEVSIFPRLLSTEEMTEIFKRFSPYFKRPRIYFPLIGRYSPELDLFGGSQATLINAPTTGAHLRIRQPTIANFPFPGEEIPVVGSVDGTSTLSASLAGSLPVAGALDGTSTASATLTAVVPVAGALDGAGDLAADLSADVPLAGAMTASADLDTSHLRLDRGFWATLDGAGEFSGSMLADVPIAGAFAGASDFTSKLDANWRICGVLVGNGAPVGYLSATVPVKGIAPAAGALQGFLSASGPGLDGAIHGVSAVTGKLAATVPLAGALAGVSAFTPNMIRIRWFSSVLQGSGAPVGTLRIRAGTRGRLDGDSYLTADPSLNFGVRSALSGYGALIGKTTSDLRLLGELTGSGAFSGRILASVDIAGSFGAAGALVAFLRRRVPEGGALAGVSTFNADLSGIPWSKGTIEAHSELVATLSRKLGLRALSEGVSALSGRLRIAGEIEQTNVGGRVIVRPENGVGGFVARWYRGES